MPIDLQVFFDTVRQSPFGGNLSQSQVEGMEFILDVWHSDYAEEDPRWLAYALATTKWETSSEMQPIAEYGKGEGQDYGEPDPETGQCYYGRGFVQLTWKDNYNKADEELELTGERSCKMHADNAMDPEIAAEVMFKGMIGGWFRSGHDLERYFNETTNDAFTAREIINGDKNYTKDWAGGKKVGDLIKADHEAFLVAIELADVPMPMPDDIVAEFRIIIRGPPYTVEVIKESDDAGS